VRSPLPIGGEHWWSDTQLLADRLRDLIATGLTTEEIAARAKPHAKKGAPVTAAKIDKILAGELIDYKVRNALWPLVSTA
jgi:hypothetical protein